ncbi:MAG: hypothetical protein ACKVYV_08850 [Limisphaerales bacterium]
MKTPPRNLHRAPLAAAGLLLTAGTASAAPFLYAPGDLVLAFRQSGAAADYVVNVGKATNYSALPPDTSLAVTNLSAAQLGSAFASLNGLRWSVAAANRPPIDPNYPLQTLWVARPRTDPDVPGAPWLRKGAPVQGNAGAQIDGVGKNAALASSLLPGGPGNTATGVIVPVNNNFNVSQVIGTAGNYANNFQGTVENLTADDFEGAPANVSRSDLYELLPGTSTAGTLNAPGRHLGYFELKPDGTLTFNTPATAGPEITSVTRVGDVTTVSFSTVTGARYQLRATGAAGLGSPVSTWSAGPTLTGNGAVQALQDSSTDAVRFFAVELLP